MGRIAWTTALLLFSTLAVSQSQPAASEHRIVTPAEQKFAPFPNIPECAKGAVLHGDPNQGASTILVKSTGTCTIPSHWHTPNEQVMIATGSARLEIKGEAAKRLTTGAYAYLTSKHAHAFSCPMACSYFIMADDKFDIHYVDEGGNEIPRIRLSPRRDMRRSPKRCQRSPHRPRNYEDGVCSSIPQATACLAARTRHQQYPEREEYDDFRRKPSKSSSRPRRAPL